MSFLEELGLSDTPYVPVSLPIGVRQGKPTFVEVLARRTSGYEQDAIDAAYMNTYSDILAEKSTPPADGGMSEMDRVRSIYSSRPKADIVEQVLGTRLIDVREKAAQLGGMDLEAIRDQVLEIKDDKEREAFAKAKDEQLKPFIEEAKKVLSEEIGKEPLDQLTYQLVQANVNLQVQMAARRIMNSQILYYTLFQKGENGEPAYDDKDVPKRVFEGPGSPNKELRGDTLDAWMEQVTEALKKDEDVPFVSPVAPEPNGLGTSPASSEQVTPASGDSTEVASEN